jgi:hypothetical protein
MSPLPNDSIPISEQLPRIEIADQEDVNDREASKNSPFLSPPKIITTASTSTNDRTLMPPPQITRPRLNDTTSSTLAPSNSTLPVVRRPRQKVVLAPGHSPLDWARLKASGEDLRVVNLKALTSRSSFQAYFIANRDAVSFTDSALGVEKASAKERCLDCY